MNGLIRLLYAVLIAVSVVTFIGVGINTFYQPPEFPESSYGYIEEPPTAEQSNEDNRRYEEYRDNEKTYNQTVGYILLPLSALVLVTGLYVMAKPKFGVVGEGFALGGLATAVYAVITASIADVSWQRFVAVTLLLVGTIILAHNKFTEPKSKAKKK